MGAPQLKRLFRSKYLEGEGFVGSLLPLSCFRFRFLLQILTVQTERTMDTMKNCNKIIKSTRTEFAKFQAYQAPLVFLRQQSGC